MNCIQTYAESRVRAAGNPERRRGNLLILAILFLVFASSAVMTTLTLVSERVRDVRIGHRDLTARHAAQGGVNQGISTVRSARDMGLSGSPFGVLDAMDTDTSEGLAHYTRIVNGQALLNSSGTTVAEFDVFIDVTSRSSSNFRDVVVSSYAYVPTKTAFTAKVRDALKADAHCTVRVQFGNAQVFDYSYFINHWGWFFGDTIVSNGNVRSNGQFDFGGYASTINGSPRYESATGADLAGYMDDNNDGVTDGSDGGVYSGFGVVNAADVRGMGALSQNQHTFAENLPMPNLSSLTWYEQQAISQGASIRVGATTYVSGVLGDGAGEKSHIALVGTAANPIVLNGPVVIRGSVIISGVVTGKGTIYSGGNIYVPKNLTLLAGPTTPRPASNSEASTEAWLTTNLNKDALGLFAREHVVIGNYTNSSWQSNVSSWVNHALNKSKEDAGADGVQNTRNGVDGVLGTADDDTLEDDGTWTVSRYSAADAAAGLIPSGKSIGDVIPGSGEDIDGDGAYDNTTQMSEFNAAAALNNANWAGNVLGAGTSTFGSISTLNISQVDAAFYTNHTLAALMTNYGGDIKMNGSIVSRNESIIYGANQIIMNHDERLSGRGGNSFGFYVPKAWDPLEVRQWEFSKSLSLPGNCITNTVCIRGYYTGIYLP